MTGMHTVRFGRGKFNWCMRLPVWDSAEITSQNTHIHIRMYTHMYVHVCMPSCYPREGAANWLTAWQKQEFKSDLKTYPGLKRRWHPKKHPEISYQCHLKLSKLGKPGTSKHSLSAVSRHLTAHSGALFQDSFFIFSDMLLGREICSWTKWSIKEQTRNKC